MYNIVEDGYYQLQRRAQYGLYILSLYEKVYEPIITTKRVWFYNNKYYDYDNGEVKYKYLGSEEKMIFRYDVGPSVTRYAKNQYGEFVYSDIMHDSDVIYF